MKRIILALLCVWCLTTVWAQKISHPSLLFTPQRIAEAKQRVSEDSVYRKAWNEIKATADKVKGDRDINRADYLALAYLMTGNKTYAEKTKKILLNISNDKSWGNAEMLARTPAWNSELNMAHKAFYAAIAYDAVYDELSGSEQKQIAEGLERLAVKPLLGDWILEPTRIHSLNSMGHNWWTSCVCMGDCWP